MTMAPLSKKTQQDLIRPKLRKTKMCSFFQEGRCRRGDACGFAHGISELEVTPDLTKTSICLAWKEGVCTNSTATCRFAHGKHDLRVLPPSRSDDEGRDEITSLLAKPPGLLPPSTSLETQVVWPSGFQPMKVNSRTESKKTAHLVPMKVQPSAETLFSQWGHWESETVAGESSSDDDGNSSILLQSQGPSGNLPSPTALFMQGYKDQMEKMSALGSLAAATQEGDGDPWPLMVPDTFDLSIFEADEDFSDLHFNKFDGAAAMSGMPTYGDASGFGFPSSEGYNSEFAGFSQFGGLPRMW